MFIPDKMNPKVAIIILNWNGWEDTIECLESLFQIDYPDYEIIVVDNGSKDESIEKIRGYANGSVKTKSKFFKYNPKNKPIEVIEPEKRNFDKNSVNKLPSDKKFILIKNCENYGFAEGNNIGIRFAKEYLNPDYILLLNNDTVVENSFLTELIKLGESEEKIGIIGPMVYYYDYEDTIQSAGVNIDWNRGKNDILLARTVDRDIVKEVKEVDYVSGCAFLGKITVFDKIGLLNPKYFAYWEETEWCIRAKKAGFKVLNTPNSRIWHKQFTTSNKVNGFMEYLMTRNMFWFMRTHATTKQFLSFILYFFGFEFWNRSIFLLINKKDKNAYKSFLKGVINGFQLNIRDD